MSAILKIRIPYYSRTISTGTNGVAEFYLLKPLTYVPDLNQTVIITHTEVASNTGLYTKLNNVGTNTVLGKRIAYSDLSNNPTQVAGNGGYPYVLSIAYDDADFSLVTYGGTCRGYIEYDVNPTNYSVLKTVESVVTVNETVPFDLSNGYQALNHTFTGATLDTTDILPGFFVGRQDNNTIFANLLKSLNLPVTDEEYKKYSRSAYGVLSAAGTNDTVAVTKNGVAYKWTAIDSSFTGTTDTLLVHPTTGWTGEHYDTVMQTIGCNEFETNKPWNLPVPNDLYMVFEIPNNKYGEIVDGKTIKLELPYSQGTLSSNADQKRLGIMASWGSESSIELYGTYNTSGINNNLDKKLSESDISIRTVGVRPDLATVGSTTYESNVVLLFTDAIKEPSSNFANWGDAYSEVINGTKVFSPLAQEKPTYSYKNDVCVGAAYLDKGFIVITHPLLVDSYFHNVFDGYIYTSNSGANMVKNYDVTSDSSGTTVTADTRGNVRTTNSGDAHELIVTKDGNDILWDSTQFIYMGPTDYMLSYNSYNTEKSLNIVCLASSDEFFKSTNDTARDLVSTSDQTDDYSSFQAKNGDLYPVIITQLGIHDADGNLLAICKPTQPIKKYWYDVVSFNIKIRL
jgi:hypothetical protein